MLSHILRVALLLSGILGSFAGSLRADADVGPYSATFLADSPGLKKKIAVLAISGANSKWTMQCWVRASAIPKGLTLIAGMGEPGEKGSRYLAIDQGKFAFRGGSGLLLSSQTAIKPGTWQFVIADFDGTVLRLFSGEAPAEMAAAFDGVGPVVYLAPDAAQRAGGHFTGEIAEFMIRSGIFRLNAGAPGADRKFF